MRIDFSVCLSAALFCLLSPNLASGQDNEPNQEPTFRSESNVVLVPVLVKDASGDAVYGLKAADFVVEDDGVAQQIRLDESVDEEPVSFVIAVQTGRRASREFSRMEGLGAMLDPLLAHGTSKVALVEFDSEVRLVRNFTSSADAVRSDLEKVAGGDGGAAVLEAVQFSVRMLRSVPDAHRRVLLLISETRDHGSKNAKLDDVVTSVGDSNVAIYTLTFSPSWSQVLDTERGRNRDEMGAGADLLAPILMARQSMRKNTPKALAEMTGGEYTLFSTRKGFESSTLQFTNHIHSRYTLSFEPRNPRPGLHRISVRLADPKATTVLARNSYWARDSSR
jgi:VWFA-related protein